MMGTIAEMEAREQRQRVLAREEAAKRVERERIEDTRRHNELLLLMFDEMAHVLPLLQQNPSKSIILIEGHDLRTVMSAHVDLRGFIAAKLAKLNLESRPFLGISEYLRERSGRG